ncbi:MAG: LLM class flavin-dependent oxidoreductase, partial [Chloroflexi bacterium]|nr:LLM class flavin-dependent oxidoreductase [Chloroflexota bacterium]
WHDIRDAGLTPLPVQHPIPIWFGANVDEAVKRAATLADGWLMNQRTPEDAKPRLEKLDQYLAESNRSRKDFGVEGRLPYGEGDKDDWRLKVEGWKSLGVTHLSFNAMGKGFNTAEAHLSAVKEFAGAIPAKI